MAISQQFGGQTLLKPGAYSQSSTTPSAGGQSATTGVMFLLGEADAGDSGANEGIQTYPVSALNQLQAKYRTGPIVDAALVAAAPSRTPGINGVSTFLVWKTNTSVQATYSLLNTYGMLTANEYGVGGNRITYQNLLSSETPATVTGSAPITAFSGLNSQTLIVATNGGASTTVTFTSPATIGDVVSQINSALTGLVVASNSGATLTLTQATGSNLQRNGWGRSFEILSTSTALSNLFLTAGLVLPTAEPEANLTLIQPRDSLTQSAIEGGLIALQVGRTNAGSCTAATIAVGASSVVLTQTGATPSTVTLSYSNYPIISGLVTAINAVAGWSAQAAPSIASQPSTSLDQATAGAFSASGAQPGRIKADASAVAGFFAASMVTLSAQATHGLPDQEGPVNLSGGLRGGSASSNFSAGLAASLAQDYNVVLPCISQPASADITMGVTDPSSTYDIQAVQAMLVSHILLRGSIQNKKEAQGVTGYRVATKAAAFAQAASLGTAEIQMCMEDQLVVDSTNNLNWKQPHIQAAMIGGMRCGSDIGEPLTHKVANTQGSGQYVNPSTGKVGGDYNPQIDYNAAIQAGVTSFEPNAGGQRVMVDNTTYGADQNFVWNRGSVVEAAQYIAKTIRADSEAAFVGQKNAVVTASSIKNRIRSKLIELFNAQITSPSSDAPQGFVEASFVVSVVGNTATVQVEVKPVQGLDFVLINFTLGQTTQTA